MKQTPQIFHTSQRNRRAFAWGDLLAIAFVIVLLYFGVRLAFNVPPVIQGPDIILSPSALPWYTLLSVGRMVAAYILSMVFTLFYGRAAAYNRRAEKLLMPLLDVLQSVPILSFLPVVLLGLSAIMPEKIAAELASVVLIFTSQSWNLTFAWYQSLTTIPKELREASAIFRLNTWMKFKHLELPFGMISLVWNSMMSWAGGWFFLMAAEAFTVGSRDFRLPGLGTYLHEAANQNDLAAIGWGLAALVLTIVILDQLVWRPLIAWSDRFKLEMTESDTPPTSWFFDLMSDSQLLRRAGNFFHPFTEAFDHFQLRRFPMRSEGQDKAASRRWPSLILMIVFTFALLYGLAQAGQLLITIPPNQWVQMGWGVLATLLRVTIALMIALAWTIPLGVMIGTNPRWAKILQPVVQVTASIPATALFPIVLLLFVDLPGGLNIAAVLLMLMGTQWYLLFNIIAGASAIPQDLKYTSQLMQLKGWRYWRTLVLPAIFPYLITGAITASGGAWNASIVAEYQTFGGQTLSLTGIGSLIAQATAMGDYPLLLAATCVMIVTVILVNRLVWRRLYTLAEEKYRME
ncbi:MAG: ABC transporter permease subunit [Anaerolineaceae bacterium]|jgi:NitT/TauT family transport system permease protein|nr:ABC transporter permease subunit [Anaerolineaceae bacterium]